MRTLPVSLIINHGQNFNLFVLKRNLLPMILFHGSETNLVMTKYYFVLVWDNLFIIILAVKKNNTNINIYNKSVHKYKIKKHYVQQKVMKK